MTALRALDAAEERLAILEALRAEQERKLQWAAAEANQRILEATRALTVAHNAAMETARTETTEQIAANEAALRVRWADQQASLLRRTQEESAERERASQSALRAEHTLALDQLRKEAERREQKETDAAARASVALTQEQKQRKELADQAAELRAQVSQLQTVKPGPTSRETQLQKELADAQEKLRQATSTLAEAKTTLARTTANLTHEHEERQKLSSLVAELQAQLSQLRTVKPGPTSRETQLQKDLADAQEQLRQANKKREDGEGQWRQKVTAVEQQLSAMSQKQKELQAEFTAAQAQGKQSSPSKPSSATPIFMPFLIGESRSVTEEIDYEALMEAMREGYDPSDDDLVDALVRHYQAEADWVKAQPLSIREMIGPRIRRGTDLHYVAVLDAMLQRAVYARNPPHPRKWPVSWVREGFELDRDSELDLVSKVKEASRKIRLNTKSR